MPQPKIAHPRFPNRTALALVAIAAVAGLCAVAVAVAAPTKTKQVVKQAQSEKLGRTILTTKAGRTLYSLSVETNGHFTCTGSCLLTWHPLVIAPGVKPTGPVRLGTVKRPDGRLQVTYKGKPLYSFGGDTKAGETNGEGIEDVGTWHAAGSPKQPVPVPPPEYPGSY
jgi:predicted lipoprotein with Yx(FWY)xxD motif